MERVFVSSVRRVTFELTAVIAGVVVPTIVAAQEQAHEWWRETHPLWWIGGVWGIVSILLMVLVFWGLIIAGIVVGARWLASRETQRRSDPALDILRQRYARGEIESDEFETKKRVLR